MACIDQVLPVTGGTRETIVPGLSTLNHIKRRQSSSDGSRMRMDWGAGRRQRYFFASPAALLSQKEGNGERDARPGCAASANGVGVFVTTSLRERGRDESATAPYFARFHSIPSLEALYCSLAHSLAHSRFSSKPNTTNLVSLRSFLCLHLPPTIRVAAATATAAARARYC